jgi:hypothetical protein
MSLLTLKLNSLVHFSNYNYASSSHPMHMLNPHKETGGTKKSQTNEEEREREKKKKKDLSPWESGSSCLRLKLRVRA